MTGVRAVTDELRRIAERAYWRVQSTDSLSLDGTTVSFTAGTRRQVKRNQRRFETEREEISRILDELGPDDVFLDVGANTGLFTCFAAAHSGARVVAAEPLPANVEVLRENCRRNGLDVTIVDQVLSNESGTTTFETPDTPDAGHGTGVMGGDGIEVPTTTIDALVSEGRIPQPTVVKVDVEGAEGLVLDGGRETFAADDCRLVVCEVHLPGGGPRPSVHDFGDTEESIRRRFHDAGFEVRLEGERNDEKHLIARK